VVAWKVTQSLPGVETCSSGSYSATLLSGLCFCVKCSNFSKCLHAVNLNSKHPMPVELFEDKRKENEEIT